MGDTHMKHVRGRRGAVAARRGSHARAVIAAILLILALAMSGAIGQAQGESAESDASANSAAAASAPRLTKSAADSDLNASWLSPSHGPTFGGNKVAISGLPQDVKFSKVDGGWESTFALDTNGHIWSWGVNDDRQLGRSVDSVTQMVPGLIDTNATFKDISAGYYSTAALDTNGHIWTWGSGSSGQLGQGTVGTNAKPTMLDLPVTFKAVNAKFKHVLALDTDGHIWSWGANVYGQLGRNGTTSSYVPTKLDFGATTFKGVATGNAYSLALDTDGHIWSWGQNNHGQLGYGAATSGWNWDAHNYTPTKINTYSTVFSQVGSANMNSWALDSTGHLWMWGYNADGELGYGSPTDQYYPGRVGSNTYKLVSTGSNHTIALDTKGVLWTWGYNVYSELCQGNSWTWYVTPTKVRVAANSAPLPTVAGIGTGYHSSFVIDDQGHIWSCGQNSSSQLGLGGLKNVPSLTKMKLNVAVTSASLDDSPVSLTLDDASGVSDFTAPAHAAGAVPLAVSWEVNNNPLPDLALQYTYGSGVGHTVRYDPAGGTLPPGAVANPSDCPRADGAAVGEVCTTVAADATAPRPADPTRDGWSFLGWYNGSNPYDFTVPVTADSLTLTAHWQQNASDSGAGAGSTDTGTGTGSGNGTTPVSHPAETGNAAVSLLPVAGGTGLGSMGVLAVASLLLLALAVWLCRKPIVYRFGVSNL